MDLQETRRQIDEIDRGIIGLYLRRMEITDRIGAWKRENHIPVYDPSRERQLLDKAAETAGEEYAEEVRELFRCILSQSKNRQEKKKEEI